MVPCWTQRAPPFPDATVTATDLTTREEFSVQTGTDGRYRLPVPEGTYQVRITRQFFESYVDLSIEANSRAWTSGLTRMTAEA